MNDAMHDALKILSIDDDAEIRYALQAVFDYQGWTALMAPDVETGLRLFDAQQPDLVLIDYHLPRINGIEGVRMLRTRSATVPIIVFTIDEDQTVADRFLEAGASDFALKPIKAPDIISRINLHIRLLESQRRATAPSEELSALRPAKGIGQPTLDLIEGALRGCAEPVSVDAIAGQTGLAYQTAYRYLQHLVATGRVEVSQTYGKIGRPKQSYHLKQ